MVLSRLAAGDRAWHDRLWPSRKGQLRRYPNSGEAGFGQLAGDQGGCRRYRGEGQDADHRGRPRRRQGAELRGRQGHRHLGERRAETCNADPCAAAAELEKAGVDFTVHVVGFGTTAEENRQLQCIADKTGGRFLGASNASELKTAMTKTVELVAKPEPPKQNVISFKKAILKLDNAHNSQFVYESSGNRINSVPIKDEMQLSPGRYSLQDSRHNHTSANFEIKAGEILNINQIAGSLVLKNAPRSQYIYNEAGNDRLNSVPFAEAVHLPPGRYKLTDGSTSQLSEAFEVKVGEETVIDFNQ